MTVEARLQGPARPRVGRPDPGPLQRLFEPVAIGGATMPNRIAMAPMTTCFAEPDGSVSERLGAFLEARARGGAGLVMTEGAAVDVLGRGWDHHLAVYDDRFLPGLAGLAARIKRHGALAWMQQMHNGRRTVSEVIGAQPVSATGLRSPGRSWEVPRRLATGEVHELADSWAAAIERAAKAGFDGVELHGGHAYLVNQFLSPAKNDRDDEFGGDAHGRARFATEIIRRAHARVGESFPIGVRLSVVEFEPGGITLEDTQETMRILEQAGAAYIDGSAGVSTLTKELRWTTGTGEATLGVFAARLRGVLERIPYMTVGRILRPETAEAVLREGQADIVGLGRALIADPDWVRKARGREPFMLCIGCNGCQQRAVHRQSGCPVNVRVGHEREYAPTPASSPRSVLVVNSGVGGLECASAAAARGHRVELAMVGLPFGGLLGLRAAVPGNEEIAEALGEYRRRLGEAGVGVDEYATTADAVAATAPEVVVDASPGPELGLLLPWPTMPLANALGRSAASLVGQRVAVVGSGYAAVEAGIALAAAGADVTVLCAEGRPARDTHPQLAFRALERLAEHGGRVRTGVPYLQLSSLARDPERLTDDLRFDVAVPALGWGEGVRPDGHPLPAAEYHAVGDTYNPWEQRFVAERGIELAMSL